MSEPLRARRRAHRQVAVAGAADDDCRVRPAGEASLGGAGGCRVTEQLGWARGWVDPES
jgi:hypothetical protein